MEVPDLDYLFQPESIAVAGVKNADSSFNPGLMFLEALKDFGYSGRLYPLNPRGGEVKGLKVYKALRDIPDRVDYVISAVPAKNAPRLVDNAAAKGVKVIHFFTSGFSETGNTEGTQLQEEIVRKAREVGVRIIGPNCLGVYCPKGGMTFNADASKESGSVGMISQSGGNASHAIAEGNSRGVRFSKVISMGNGVDLNESDFLEYLAHDNDTEIITAYIEGVKDGPRFLRAVKAAAKIKPVIILKVGLSEVGADVAVSHTTALAGSTQVWEGLLRQAGAVQVHSIEEMIDMTLAFLHMSPPAGGNAVIAGIGGGASVILADEFSREGLSLPRFSRKTLEQLMGLYSSDAGRIFKNPIDINNFESPDTFLKTIQLIEAEKTVDFLVLHVAFDHFGLMNEEIKDFAIGFYQSLIIDIKNKVNKPVAVLLHSFASDKTKKMAREIGDTLTREGFPVFLSIRNAAAALKRYVQYRKRLQSGDTA
ncbi:MAG: hypothetical protein AVO39_05185 [delta proteobacterium MLS_D]|nr:MAG: hypothetical protein AVO39_05185 [delta proteobacterium MLS_D]